MRITDLKVDGFGAWQNLRLEELNENLTVFYGPNEAGKTTLMQFVRGVLYGFAAGRRRRYLNNKNGITPGGALDVTTTSGRFRLARHSSPERLDDGDLAISGADGSQHSAQMLAAMLADVDEATFNNVFAVGLRELQELGTLADTEAAKWLYRLTSGLDRVSLVDVLRELEISRNRILAADGRACRVTNLMAERERLQVEIDELAGGTRRWAQLVGQRERLDRQIASAEEEVTRLNRTSQLLQLAIALRDRWQLRETLAAQLASAPTIDLADDALARLEALQSRIDQRRQRRDALRAEVEALGQETSALAVNESLWRLAPRIEALGEQQHWLSAIESQVRDLTQEVAELQGQWDSQRQRLGLLTGSESAPVEISRRTQSSLRGPAKAVSQAKGRVAKLEREAAGSLDAAVELEAELTAALSGHEQNGLSQALEVAGNRVAQLRRRISLDDRLVQLEDSRKELESQSTTALDTQLMPLWMLGGLGGVFVVAVCLIFAGWWVESSLASTFGWLLALVGVCAGVTKFFWEKSAAQNLDNCRKQLDLIVRQTQQTKQEREDLDAELPRGGGPLAARLQAAERELQTLEGLLPVDARRQAASQEAAAADVRMARAKEELKAARRGWRNALISAGLPEGLTPKQARELAARSGEAADVRKRLQRRNEELEQRRREFSSVAQRVAQLMHEVGETPLSDSTVERIHQLLSLVETQESRVKRRDAIRVRTRELRKDEARQSRLYNKLRNRRQSIFQHAGCNTEHEYRLKLAERTRLGELRAQHDAVDREIAATVAAHTNLVDISPLLAFEQRRDLERQAGELTGQLEDRRQLLARYLEQRGSLAEQQRQLLDDRRLAERRLDLGVVEQQLAEAIEAWQVRAVVSRLLDTIRKDFEQHRQPETLVEASTYLRRLTEGHYVRVWTPLGENALLVDDADGKAWPVDVLSRGTREQLFLSLRLALVALYRRRGIQLPLVLDDVLVNFDSGRAKAAAGVLRDFAKGDHQLLVFTCHEHVWKMFKTMKVDARRLPSREQPLAQLVLPPVEEVVEEPVEEVVEAVVMPPSAPVEPEPIVVAVPVIEEVVAAPSYAPIEVEEVYNEAAYALVDDPTDEEDEYEYEYEYEYVEEEVSDVEDEIEDDDVPVEEIVVEKVIDDEVDEDEETTLAEESEADAHRRLRGALGWEVEIEESWTNQVLDESEAA